MDRQYRSIKKTIYRLFLVIGCGVGLFIKLGLYSGKIKWYTLMYYTNWSNFFVFVLFLFLLLFPECNQNKKLLNIKGGVTMMILLTGFIYHFLLNGKEFTMLPITTAEGLGSFLLHYNTPLLVFLDWFFWDKKGVFFSKAPLFWAILPYIYMILIFFVASKGSFIPNQNTKYPYRFIAVDLIGWQSVAVNVIALSACYIMAGYIYVWLDKIWCRAIDDKNVIKKRNRA